jgi:methyl-accepting chemotaxis protein
MDYYFAKWLEDRVNEILRRMNVMEQAIAALMAEVQRNGEVTASAVALINGIADQLEQFADDPAQVMALAEQLRSRTDELAAAVSENTQPAV